MKKISKTGSATLENQHFPARLCERTAKEEAVHDLVDQPIKNHLPAPRANSDPQFEATRIIRVIVVSRINANHLHVESDG